MKLIARESARKALESIGLQVGKNKMRTVARCLNAIEMLPTIDAVPVVRCRECKYHRNAGCPMRTLHVATHGYAVQDNTVDDGFCHMGAKMDGGASDG